MNVNKQRAARVAELEGQLVEHFSNLLRMEDVAEVLAISHRCAQVADQRGVLPVKMKKIPGRRGKVVPARTLAEYLASLEG